MNSTNSLAYLVSHSDGRLGKVDILQDYLLEKGFSIKTILHPLDDYANLDTTVQIENGQSRIIKRKSFGPLSYIIDTYISAKLAWSNEVTLYVGLSNLDILPAIFVRKLRPARLGKIIYIPSDYSGNRFNNGILNLIYNLVETIVVRHADLVASNTIRAEAKRQNLGLSADKSVLIPNGVRINPPSFPHKTIDKSTFVYVGDVNKEHGLYELIQTLGNSIKKLVLIGSGPDWDRTVALAQKYSFTTETYYKVDRDFVLTYLQNFSGFGLAPYNDSAEWTYYCSPVKVGEYIACGVPVLMSKRPEVSAFVEDKRYGIAYHDLNREALLSDLDNFDTTDYWKKAREFYIANNVMTLLEKLRV